MGNVREEPLDYTRNIEVLRRKIAVYRRFGWTPTTLVSAILFGSLLGMQEMFPPVVPRLFDRYDYHIPLLLELLPMWLPMNNWGPCSGGYNHYEPLTLESWPVRVKSDLKNFAKFFTVIWNGSALLKLSLIGKDTFSANIIIRACTCTPKPASHIMKFYIAF